ncbi:MAG: TlpA family protein disulfide reductase [Bacteroidales bacterium]
MKKLIFTGLLLVFALTGYCQHNLEDLRLVFKTINNLQRVTYNQVIATSTPFDTINMEHNGEFVNLIMTPNDSSEFIYYNARNDDNTFIKYIYDGSVTATLDWDEQTVQIDSLDDSKRKNIPSPFFLKAKSLIEYVLANQDSVSIRTQVYADSLVYSFLFYNKKIYFHAGISIFNKVGAVSKYMLTIDRNLNLPIGFLQKMSNQYIFNRVSNIKIADKGIPFKALDIIPSNFERTKPIDYQSIFNKAMAMKGKIAPDWSIPEVDGDTVSLKSIDSKVILLQFTTLGCGVCHMSTSFMKELVSKYKNNNVKIVSMEFSKGNVKMFKDYKRNNGINYSYLIGNKSIAGEYGVIAGPTFIIINSKKEIVDIQVGYSRGYSEKVIEEIIDSLL